ncbi:MAG: tRNA (adenosine(37)-N6)-threonylcarbamoyltransferase complex dimerization subunit type 1 TsaB [Bacteroidota bacterium]
MALILHLETASPVCSVALSREGQLLAVKESLEDKSHAKRLTVFIIDILNANGLTVPDLDAISLSLGPGSYTGLRIGTSVAKGLAYGSGKPLIGIPTLQALAVQLVNRQPVTGTLLCPMLDARRMEVYAAIYTPDLDEINPVEAVVIDKDSFSNILDKQPVWFFGTGSNKAKEVIVHPNARFADGIQLSAGCQGMLAEQAFNKQDFLSTAYFEPHYLKEFIATVPKNKVMGMGA